MKKNLFLKVLFSFTLSFFLISSLSAQTREQQEIIDDALNAKEAFIQMDPYMKNLFKNSEAYAIFPNVGAGAYILGAASGNGAVFQNGRLIGMADLKQINVGLQFGGKAYREVIFFQNEAALERFKQGNFSLSGNVSAVVLEEGVGETVNFENGLAIVTMPKAGAMIEVSVGGQRFKFEPL